MVCLLIGLGYMLRRVQASESNRYLLLTQYIVFGYIILCRVEKGWASQGLRVRSPAALANGPGNKCVPGSSVTLLAVTNPYLDGLVLSRWGLCGAVVLHAWTADALATAGSKRQSSWPLLLAEADRLKIILCRVLADPVGSLGTGLVVKNRERRKGGEGGRGKGEGEGGCSACRDTAITERTTVFLAKTVMVHGHDLLASGAAQTAGNLWEHGRSDR